MEIANPLFHRRADFSSLVKSDSILDEMGVEMRRHFAKRLLRPDTLVCLADPVCYLDAGKTWREREESAGSCAISEARNQPRAALGLKR